MRIHNLPVVVQGTWVYDGRLTRAIRIVQSTRGQEWDGHDDCTGEYLSDEKISQRGFELNEIVYVIELEETFGSGKYVAHGPWSATIDEAKRRAGELPAIGHTICWNTV